MYIKIALENPTWNSRDLATEKRNLKSKKSTSTFLHLLNKSQPSLLSKSILLGPLQERGRRMLLYPFSKRE
jgi:hypothetical protein